MTLIKRYFRSNLKTLDVFRNISIYIYEMLRNSQRPVIINNRGIGFNPFALGSQIL